MTDATAEAPGARLERCPNCNARLPDTPVSICPYCVFPLGTERAVQAAGADSPHRGRIQRVREHEEFAAAEALDPPESLEFQRGGLAIFYGKVVLSVAAAFAALGAWSAGAGLLTHWSTWVGIVAALGALVWIARGRARRERAVALPLLRRPGLILDRRSETDLRGWGGSTTYFFEIEFEDGTRGEFHYPGRGAQQDPYVTGLPGVAFTRGKDLLLFQHIRV